MIFFRFIARTYFSYLISVAFSLATLYSFIEVLEKMMRCRTLDGSCFFLYGLVVFFPSFIKLFPLSSFLGSLLFLREIVLRQTYVAMVATGVSIRWLLGVILVCSILTSTAIFLIQESIGYRAAREMAKQKISFFRGGGLSHSWLRLGSRGFVYTMNDNKNFFLLDTESHMIALGSRNNDGAASITERVFLSSEQASEKIGFMEPISLIGLDLITSSLQEESFFHLVKNSNTPQGKNDLSVVIYFFMKIVFLSVVTSLIFFYWIDYPYLRWGGVFTFYLVLEGFFWILTQFLSDLVSVGVLLVLATLFSLVIFIRIE